MLAKLSWNPASLPDWLTERKYRSDIQPRLKEIPTSATSLALGVSKPYASEVRKGHVSHPRHRQALAELVGISRESSHFSGETH